LGVNIVELIDV